MIPVANACSSMLFTGAKPVEPATKTIGLPPSSRRWNEPSGPSKRRRSPTFIASNTCGVKRPPAMSRTCSSIVRPAPGAVANEKLRFAPSGSTS